MSKTSGLVAFCSIAIFLSQYLHAASGPIPTPANKLVDQAKRLIDQGRIAEAEVVLTQAHILTPKNPETIALLGKVKGSLGELRDAQELFQQVIQLLPHSADAHIDLAIVLSDEGNLPQALVETSKALAISPNLPTAHLNRARILADLNRSDEAILEFRIACRLAPNDPDGFYYWSLLAQQRGDFAKESSLLQRVVQLQPRNDRAFFLLGRSLVEQSKNDEATIALRSALTLNPNSTGAIYMLSRLLQRSDPEQAAQLRRRFAIVKNEEANVEKSKTIADNGYEAFAQGSWSEAISQFRDAIVVCHGCEIEATLHKNLGLALCRNLDLQEGEVELQKALELNPNDVDTLSALTIVRHQTRIDKK
jgi:tetratricopeptide (TPR) repeat protein